MARLTRSLCESLRQIVLTAQLEDLYVSPEYRAKGLGKRLFGELGAIAKERNCGRVEWRVLKVRSASTTEVHSIYACAQLRSGISLP